MAGGTQGAGRMPALDGLRGVAVSLVVLGHSGIPFMNGAATVGVTVFFVLSGFLITSLLLHEHHSTGTINLNRFYRRRARRLAPAAALFLTVMGGWFYTAGVPLTPILLGAVQAANLAGPLGVPLGAASHLWSLSLEEQFYGLWPLVLVPLVRLRNGTWVVAGAASASALWRLHLATGPNFEFFAYRPDTRADAILVGCLLAILASRGVVRRSRRAPTTAAACVVFAALPFGDIVSSYTIGPVAVASAVLVWWAAGAPSIFLSWGPLRGLGRISYGLYLWHMPVAGLVLTATGGPTFTGAVLIFAASISLALASWFVVEEPIQAGRQAGRVIAGPFEEHRTVAAQMYRPTGG